jgi:hypothetical protein
MDDLIIISRQETATECHEKAIVAADNITSSVHAIRTYWLELAEALAPIYENEYWHELGFNSWGAYIKAIGMRVTTAMNSVRPYIELMKANISPRLLEEVPQNRAVELAVVAKASGGKLEPSLIEKAKDTGSRLKAQAFREAIEVEKDKYGIENFRTIKLTVPKSLYEMWSAMVNHFAGKTEPTPADMTHLFEICLSAATPEVYGEG